MEKVDRWDDFLRRKYLSDELFRTIREAFLGERHTLSLDRRGRCVLTYRGRRIPIKVVPVSPEEFSGLVGHLFELGEVVEVEGWGYRPYGAPDGHLVKVEASHASNCELCRFEEWKRSRLVKATKLESPVEVKRITLKSRTPLTISCECEGVVRVQVEFPFDFPSNWEVKKVELEKEEAQVIWRLVSSLREEAVRLSAPPSSFALLSFGETYEEVLQKYEELLREREKFIRKEEEKRKERIENTLRSSLGKIKVLVTVDLPQIEAEGFIPPHQFSAEGKISLPGEERIGVIHSSPPSEEDWLTYRWEGKYRFGTAIFDDPEPWFSHDRDVAILTPPRTPNEPIEFWFGFGGVELLLYGNRAEGSSAGKLLLHVLGYCSELPEPVKEKIRDFLKDPPAVVWRKYIEEILRGVRLGVPLNKRGAKSLVYAVIQYRVLKKNPEAFRNPRFYSKRYIYDAASEWERKVILREGSDLFFWEDIEHILPEECREIPQKGGVLVFDPELWVKYGPETEEGFPLFWEKEEHLLRSEEDSYGYYVKYPWREEKDQW